MKLKIAAASLSLILAACVMESQATFDAKPFEVTQTFARDYQAVYADIVKGARTCWEPGPMITGGLPNSDILDAQLYPNLGYGEVYSYATGTVFMPRVLVRIEKQGSGSMVSVKTGPQAAKEKLFRAPPMAWATGNFTCY